MELKMAKMAQLLSPGGAGKELPRRPAVAKKLSLGRGIVIAIALVKGVSKN